MNFRSTGYLGSECSAVRAGRGGLVSRTISRDALRELPPERVVKVGDGRFGGVVR